KHPYTQLLVASMPLPDPKRRWGEDVVTREEEGHRTSIGCKFASRCPAAHEPCWTTVPPLYRTETERAVACFLPRPTPTLETEALSAVLAKSELATTAEGQDPVVAPEE